MNVLVFLIGLIGAALVAFGGWLIFPPAGYIAGGLLCLLWSLLMAKALSSKPAATQGEH